MIYDTGYDSSVFFFACIPEKVDVNKKTAVPGQEQQYLFFKESISGGDLRDMGAEHHGEVCRDVDAEQHGDGNEVSEAVQR